MLHTQDEIPAHAEVNGSFSLEYILRPSSAFERDFAGAQQCHVMIPMDG